jgi:phosphate transport system substrate-binding protein
MANSSRLFRSEGHGRGVVRRLPGCLSLAFSLLLTSSLCHAQDTIALVGSGSSVPAPLIAKWAEEYNKSSSKVSVRYLPLGTSEGIRQISHGVGDFAAGEAPLTAKEKAEGQLTEVPILLVGIVPIYNLPGVSGEMRFTGLVLADIYLGRIKNWNAPELAKINPGLSLPNLPIKIVYRPAGKGSNYIFSDFLSKSSPQFKNQIGVSASPTWPVGSPAERSSDMADKVAEEPGAIGYVEAQYAFKTHIPSGLVLNRAGHFVKASDRSLTAACNAVEGTGWDRFSASLIDATGVDSYPIASFSWIYFRTESSDQRRRAALADFFRWILADGQQVGVEEGYPELPSLLRENVKGKVSKLLQ